MVDTNTLPADVVNTVDPDGGFDSMSNVTLATGEDNLDQDFGYVEDLGSIGDTIFLDANGNGTPDAGEGIAGVDVKLDIDGDGVFDLTETTDADGNYLFSDLNSGDYTVMVDTNTLPADVVNTVDPDGGFDSMSNVTLGTGEDNLDQDFGYVEDLGSIGDTIFLDSNGNGTPDAGEGIAGVDVKLDIDGDGVFDLTETTDADGNYLFSDLNSGDYTVMVDTNTLPADVVNTVDPDGGFDSMSNLTLATGEDNLDQDFGYVEDLGSIGDTIFLDANGNGTPDAGEGIAGVDVKLDIDGDGVFDQTTTTNANGEYLFSDLNSGDYTVMVDTTTLPADVVNTVDPDGGFDSMSNVTLATGEDNLDQDFGYVEDLGSIGDTIFLDANGNGTPDAGEGIAGVDVKLDIDGDGVFDQTTTTNAKGNIYSAT